MVILAVPTYEYRCPAGHDFEHFVPRISEGTSTMACPTCGAVGERRISAGGGLLFKGSGFYITDYGKDGKKDQRTQATASASSKDGSKKDGAAADTSAASSDRKTSDAKGADAKGSDAKSSDAKGSDARGSDARGSDAKGSGSKGSDTKGSDAKGSGAKGTAPAAPRSSGDSKA
jgi:putative FmdB family regulatory protein